MNTNEPTQVYLSPPSQKGGMSLAEAITRRRSVRDFAPESISRSQLSEVLRETQGTSDASWGYRTIPNAGATYPLEIFVVCGSNCLEQIGDGIYHYNIDSYSLTLRHKGDIRLELARATLDKEAIYEVPVDIAICAVYERTLKRTGFRFTPRLISFALAASIPDRQPEPAS